MGSEVFEEHDEADLIDAAATALASGSGGAAVRRVLDNSPAAIAIIAPPLRYLYVNAAYSEIAGVPAADLLGRAMSSESVAVLASEGVVLQVLTDGRSRELTVTGSATSALSPEQRSWRGAYHRLESDGATMGVVCVLREAPPEQHPQGELVRARARLRLLNQAATRIGTTLDADATCAELAQFLFPRLADFAAVDLLPSEAVAGGEPRPQAPLRLRRVAAAGRPALLNTSDFYRTSGVVKFPPESPVFRCTTVGYPVVQNHIPDAGLAEHAPQPGWPTHSILAVPLVARDCLIGVISLARAYSAEGFNDHDVVLMRDLASRAAVDIDKAHRFTATEGIAVTLQRALLAEPGSPHPNINLATRYLPSGTSAVVGGDWYEVVRLHYGRTLLVMGDVMGHGVEAAVDMSNYRSMLRYFSATDLPPHRVLRQLDRAISDSATSRPATCLLALIDPGRSICSLSSAGHLPPVVFDADGTAHIVDVPTGPPLGTGFGGYELTSRDIGPDKVWLLYTDGLVERRDEDIDASLGRLAGLRLASSTDLDEFLDAVLQHCGADQAEDDVAVLAARLRHRRETRAPARRIT
ncbi:PP2C family protein-serine/threonine phosphatase [Streptomyces sp. NPDC002851]